MGNWSLPANWTRLEVDSSQSSRQDNTAVSTLALTLWDYQSASWAVLAQTSNLQACEIINVIYLLYVLF